MHSVSSRNGWLPSRLVLFLLSVLRDSLLVFEHYDSGRDVLQVSGNVTTFPSTAAIVAEHWESRSSSQPGTSRSVRIIPRRPFAGSRGVRYLQ